MVVSNRSQAFVETRSRFTLVLALVYLNSSASIPRTLKRLIESQSSSPNAVSNVNSTGAIASKQS